MLHRVSYVLMVAVLLGLALRETRSVHQNTAVGASRVPPAVQPVAPADLATTNDQPSRYFLASGTTQVTNKSQDTPKSSASNRLREGREIRDPNARFTPVGERMNCVLPSLDTMVTVLENLTLERVYEIMTRHDEAATWEVEGLITEHQGRNYIVLRRAVINSISLDEQ
ncbi:MAG: hypothetical protein Q8M16_17155 [Pirellulaceae bacterium]|nr:hypothetical protein [Pirellulaceae bacterium]